MNGPLTDCVDETVVLTVWQWTILWRDDWTAPLEELVGGISKLKASRLKLVNLVKSAFNPFKLLVCKCSVGNVGTLGILQTTDHTKYVLAAELNSSAM